jgi:lipopolysaccharide cholinephosphotransferase
MYTIDEIHMLSYEMLKEVNRICTKYDLEVFLDSGTLLGAVRHQDFIPWDDDIDVIVKRENYHRFVSALKRELDPRYEFVNYRDYNGLFFDFVPRIELKDSQLREITDEDKAYNNKQNKICIDIFILDDIPNNGFLYRLHLLSHKILYGLAMGHRYELDYSKYSFCQKLSVKFLSGIGKHISLQRIFRWHERWSARHHAPKYSRYMVSNHTLMAIDFVFQKEWYSSSVRLPIRDTEFLCPGGWDAILTLFYGDYMTPPPLEERVPQHASIS